MQRPSSSLITLSQSTELAIAVNPSSAGRGDRCISPSSAGSTPSASGSPTSAARSAVVAGPHSLECDAVSTALLVRGAEWLPTLRTRFPEYDGDVV